MGGRGRRVRRRRAPLLRWFVRLRGSPEAIAAGVAIGCFVAFTPTIGFQLVLAALLATLLGANRPAALVPVWITNPVTIPPVFAFTYWVGSRFWAGPPPERVRSVLRDLVGRLSHIEFWELRDQLVALLALSRDVLVPLAIGGVLVGLVAGGVAYVGTVEALRGLQRRREARRRRRRDPGARLSTSVPAAATGSEDPPGGLPPGA